MGGVKFELRLSYNLRTSLGDGSAMARRFKSKLSHVSELGKCNDKSTFVNNF